MTLTDLMNHHYTRAVREGMMDLTLGRSDHEVKIGDIVEMLLSISFAVKDAMLEWEWLGIDIVATSEIGLGDAPYRTSGLCQQNGRSIRWMAPATMAHSLFSTKVYGMSRVATATCVSNLPQE